MPSVYTINMKRSLLLECVDLKASTLYLKVCKKDFANTASNHAHVG